jgi:hypothetical protein
VDGPKKWRGYVVHNLPIIEPCSDLSLIDDSSCLPLLASDCLILVKVPFGASFALKVPVRDHGFKRYGTFCQ